VIIHIEADNPFVPNAHDMLDLAANLPSPGSRGATERGLNPKIPKETLQ
jgi:hypothetical protein